MLGVYKNLSNDDYHNDTTAISRSGLWEFRKAPAKYWNSHLNPDRPPKKITPDMEFGSAFHTFVLEPHLFYKKYAVLPEGIDKRTNDGKARFADFLIKSQGKTALKKEEMDKLILMKESVLNHPEASQLIVGGAVEHSIFWEDRHSGVLCKTRPDIWHDNMTVDLKTTSSADERSFINSVASYGYHLQSAMNREGIYQSGGNDITTHAFVCVEKEWPHLVAVYILDNNTLDFAHNMFKNTLQDFKKCKESNIWNGYETKEITLPAWAL